MKNKTSLISIAIISLFVVSMNVKAGALYVVEYPESSILGETFEIKVLFTYETETDALYGGTIYLYYSINEQNVPTIDYEDNILYEPYSEVGPTNIPLYPRPESVSFFIETDVNEYILELGDVFRFIIKYKVGVILPAGNVVPTFPSTTIYTETYTVTIISEDSTSENTDIIDESLPAVYVPLIVLSSLIVISAIIIKVKK